MRKAPQHAAGISALTVGKPDPKILQDFLALKFALSRRTAKAMIDGRSVWVNRKCVWIARFALRTGDLVEIPSQVVKGAVKQSGGEDFRRKTGDGGVSRLKSKVLRVAIIPLLFETHWDADYDIICCVHSARATQVARMMETRGYTREEAEARLAAQMPVEEKAAKSHYVIENNGSADELKSEVERFVTWLKNSMCLRGR